MSCRGVHFALTDEQASRLIDTPGADDDFLLDWLEEIEEKWDEEWLQETDKSWDAIHRCLTDGKLKWGDTPLHKCILGAENLYKGGDWIMNFLRPEEVKEVAAAIKNIDSDELRRRYDAIHRSYGKLSDEDFEYTWSWFPQLRDFFQKAAAANRAMLFAVDQ
jgi:Domain of unknown function (DUF1877)